MYDPHEGVTSLVSKSYLGNGAWKAASKVPKGELRAALGAHPTADWAGNAAGRKIHRGMSVPKGKTVTTSYHPALRSNAPGEDGLRAAGIAYGNGKGGGHIKLDTLTPPDKQDKVMRHEMAHIAPRRNPRHLSERMFDPVKRGREEGRASYIADGKPTPGGHDSGSNAKFKLGYDEVQNKMHEARQRKVSKAAWKNWSPAPPTLSGRIRKIPMREAHIKTGTDPAFGSRSFTSHNRRGTVTGGLNVSQGGDYAEPVGHIDSIGVQPGMRRRGLGTRLFDAAKKEIPETYHAPTRTAMGEKYARGEAKRTGKPRQIETNRWLDDNPNRKQRARANKADFMRETNGTSRTGNAVRGKVAGLKRPGALWDRSVAQMHRQMAEDLKPLPFEKAGHSSGETVRDALARYGKKEGFTVKKSYIGGGQWRAATKLTPKQALKVPGAHLKKPRLGNADRKFKSVYGTPKTRLIMEATPQGIRHEQGGFLNGGGTARFGSAKGGKSYVIGASSNMRSHRMLVAHEGAHAAPQRSGYRLHGQIGANPTKLMREEGRADYTGHGRHYSKVTHPLETTPYSVAANARDRALAHPNRYAKGSKNLTETMHDFGVADFKRPTNKTVYEGAKQNIVNSNQMLSRGGTNYGKGGTPDKAVDGYREVQDKIRAARERKVSKSYLGGAKGWVRAGEAGAKALRRAKGAHKAARGVSVEDEGYKIQQFLRQTAIDEGIAHGHVEQMPNGHTKITRFSRAYGRLTPDPALSDGTHAYALKQGGRKGKGYLFVNELSNDSDIAHEMAHLTPKRSAYRMNHQTMGDGRKYMREEARADMEGGSYYRDPDAAGSGYKDMANDDKYRRKMGRGRAAESISREILVNNQGFVNGIKQGWKKRPYSKESMDDFRNLQDKIAGAQGHPHAPQGAPEKSSKSHKFYGNQYVKWGAGMTGAAAFGGGGAAFYAHKKQQDEHLIEKGMLNNLGAKVGAHYNVGLNRVANAIEPKPVVPAVHRRVAPIVRSNGRTYGAPPKPGTLTRVANHPLVKPVRTAAADQVRDIAHDATPIWDQVEGMIGKRAPQGFNPHDGISAEVSRR